jgi:hypothetical protein
VQESLKIQSKISVAYDGVGFGQPRQPYSCGARRQGMLLAILIFTILGFVALGLVTLAATGAVMVRLDALAQQANVNTRELQRETRTGRKLLVNYFEGDKEFGHKGLFQHLGIPAEAPTSEFERGLLETAAAALYPNEKGE